jgi:competence protein ComEC
VGAASALAGRVGTVLVGPSDGPGADRLLDTLASAGARVHSTVAGDSGRLGDLDWRVLWPRPADEPGNDASVVLRVDSADLSAVFLGDLGAEAQDALLRTVRIRPADVVSVAHHGSADQSPRLYEMLSPRIALVSAGIGNPYGHPTATALQILDSLGAVALRTDTSGSAVVGIGRSGGELLAWTARSKSNAIDGRDVGGEP